MQSAVLWMACSSLGRAAARLAAGLVLLFVLASTASLAGTVALLAAAAGVRLPAAATADAPTVPVTTPPGAPTPDVVAVASQYLGMPYAWGGASPSTSFDCSGLVQWSFGQLGVRLPRTAQMQFDATARVPTGELQPGDLVFFRNTYYSPGEPITHVGIYVGDGQMINAPVEGKPISVMPVFTGFWGAHYAGGGRVG
jgi:cell wall-associated NlpC family hydrolase